MRVERAATPRGAEALVQVLAQVAVALGPVARLGVGAAGLVTRDGVLRAGPNLPGITELRLRDELADRLGRDVMVDNDATCAVLRRVAARCGSRGGRPRARSRSARASVPASSSAASCSGVRRASPASPVT